MGAQPIGSHGRYRALTFAVPRAVAEAARAGLALRAAGRKGGTDVGVARARQLATGSPRVTLRDLVYMRAYFARHAIDWRPGWEELQTPGYVAWLLWGGDAARRVLLAADCTHRVGHLQAMVALHEDW